MRLTCTKNVVRNTDSCTADEYDTNGSCKETVTLVKLSVAFSPNNFAKGTNQAIEDLSPHQTDLGS